MDGAVGSGALNRAVDGCGLSFVEESVYFLSFSGRMFVKFLHLHELSSHNRVNAAGKRTALVAACFGMRWRPGRLL